MKLQNRFEVNGSTIKVKIPFTFTEIHNLLTKLEALQSAKVVKDIVVFKVNGYTFKVDKYLKVDSCNATFKESVYHNAKVTNRTRLVTALLIINAMYLHDDNEILANEHNNELNLIIE